MKILDITAELERFAALELQEAYDNAGLILGMNDWECAGVLCCLDVTNEVVEEAISKNCNLIIAHHPLIFRGVKNITGSTWVEKVLVKAIKNDIAIYAAHTNLDNILYGVNGMIAKKLKLENVSILQPKQHVLRRLITFAPTNMTEKVRQALFDAGAGGYGKYEACSFSSEGVGTFKAMPGASPYVGELGKMHKEREMKIEVIYPFYLEKKIIQALLSHHPYEEVAYDIYTLENDHPGFGSGIIGELNEEIRDSEFLQLVQHTFSAVGIRHSRLSGKMVKTVAVCGGAGSFLIGTALKKGADIYLTADLKYHDFFETAEKMVIADIGHYESEQFTIELIYDILLEKFPTFAVLKTKVNTNPIRYLKSKIEGMNLT